MKEAWLKILLLNILGCGLVNVQHVPNVFPICSRRTPDLGKCIKDALNKLRPNLASGRLSPDFIIQPLDPYVMSHYELGNERFLKATFYDIELVGTTKFRLVDIRAYFEGNFLKFMPHIEIDRLDIKTKYSLTGPFPFPQTGSFSMTLSDLKVHGNGRVHIYKRDDGREYFKIEQAKLMFDSIKPGNVKFSFPIGKKREARLLNLIFRFFGDPIMKALYKLLERRIDEVHLDVANDFIKDVPFDYFFSE